jgi:hypothetical protein
VDDHLPIRTKTELDKAEEEIQKHVKLHIKRTLTKILGMKVVWNN